MKKITMLNALVLLAATLFAQAPQGFNYQAVARDAQGNVIQSENLAVRITIYSNSTAVWTELHSEATNAQGLFSLVVGDPAVSGSGTAGSFEQINWGDGVYSLGIEVDAGNGYIDMGTSLFQSVPYALYSSSGSVGGSGSGWEINQDTLSSFNYVGIGTRSPSGSALTVQGFADKTEAPLFEVRREDGVPVFAVFNDGVMVYVDEETKGIKGGFAVGGYNQSSKGVTQEYLRVTPDSVRIYVPDDERVKGIKGGFAVGGYNQQSKGFGQDLLYVTSDSIRLYVPNKENDPGVVGLQGGFAVETFDPDALPNAPREYIMGMNRGITRFNTADNRNGFAIGSQGEGWSSTYLQVTPVNTFVGFESGVNTRNDPGAWFAGQGSMNVFMGYKSGWENIFGHHNVFLGYQAGFNMVGDSLDEIQGSNNVFVGPWAGLNLNDGWSNVFLGENSGREGTSSYGNIFIGSNSGRYANGAGGNIAIGQHAGQYLENSNNVMIGESSGSNNTDGTGNVFLGAFAGANAYGSSNVFIGSNAGSGEEGSNRLYIENTNSSSPLIWGDFSTDLLRFNAEVGINTPSYGIRLNVLEDRPDSYGSAIAASNNQTADVGTGIEGHGGAKGVVGWTFDNNGDPGSAAHTGVYGGASDGTTNYGVYGWAGPADASYAVYADGNLAYTGVLYSLSDQKFKDNINPIDGIMTKLMEIQPRHYDVMIPSESKSTQVKSRSQYGFVAQELEQVFPDLVEEVTGIVHKDPREKVTGKTETETYKGVKYMEMIPILLKGMQEQQAEIEALKAEIELLKAK